MRVASYLRLSKNDKRRKKESMSVQNQRMIIDSYLKQLDNYIFVGEFIDDGFTGMNFERPGYICLRQLVEKKSVDLILVKDISRFGRNDVMVLSELQEFLKMGVAVIGITDNVNSKENFYHLSTRINIVLNQAYSQNLSCKIKSTVKIKHKNGLFIGAFTSYGYKRDPKDKHHLVIDDDASKVVKQIFDSYISGENQQSIARKLNKENVLCPSDYKRLNGENYHNNYQSLTDTHEWTYSTVHRILSNQMYAGDMVQGKRNCSKFNPGSKTIDKQEWDIVENTHEAIIPRERFELVQKLLAKRTRCINMGNISIYAGLIRCGDCGKALVKTVRGGKITYICSRYKNTGNCTRHAIKEEELSEYILKRLNEEAETKKEELRKLAKNQKKRKSEKDSIEMAIDKIQSAIASFSAKQDLLRNDKINGLISQQEYENTMKSYSEDKVKNMERIAELKKHLGKNQAEIMLENPVIIQLINGHFDKITRELAVTYIDKILIYDDGRVIINWTFKK